MKKTITIITILALAFTFTARAQQAGTPDETGFRVTFGDKDREYHNTGAGAWYAWPDREETPGKGITLNYCSWTFLADADFDGKRLVNAHINPHIHLTVSYRSEGGFRSEARLYPVVGVAGLTGRDPELDYGAVLNITNGWKAGVGICIRVTRSTYAGALCIAF